MVCAVLCVNTAYLGYPLTVALLGRDQLPTAVLYDMLVNAPTMLLGAFAVGAAFGTKAGESVARPGPLLLHPQPAALRRRSPACSPRTPSLPRSRSTSRRRWSIAMLPLSFFAVGATLAENAEHGELPFPPPLTRPVALAVGVRLVIAPGLLILFAAPLIDLPAAYLLIAAMPSGITSMVIAHTYGLDMEIAAEAVAWSSAIVVAGALRLAAVLIAEGCCTTSDRGRARGDRALGALLGAARLRAGRAARGRFASSPGSNARGPRST